MRSLNLAGWKESLMKEALRNPVLRNPVLRNPVRKGLARNTEVILDVVEVIMEVIVEVIMEVIMVIDPAMKAGNGAKSKNLLNHPDLNLCLRRLNPSQIQ